MNTNNNNQVPLYFDFEDRTPEEWGIIIASYPSEDEFFRIKDAKWEKLKQFESEMKRINFHSFAPHNEFWHLMSRTERFRCYREVRNNYLHLL